MNQFEEIAQSLTDCLELRTPPVAVCLTDTPPAGVSASSQPAPAGCSFWERGARAAFMTSPQDHENCAVGMYTHHMPLDTASRQKNLNDSLKVFEDLGYVRPEDIPGIATLAQEPKYVVYAPLSSTPMPPNVVLLFANSRQGLAIIMISSEMPEILGMSDRIGVMHNGRLMAILDRGAATQEKLLALALGHAEGASAA